MDSRRESDPKKTKSISLMLEALSARMRPIIASHGQPSAISLRSLEAKNSPSTPSCCA
jgi:hypothetical protein